VDVQYFTFSISTRWGMKEIKGIPVSRNCLNTLLISDDKGIMSN
jgi:hypothetical protein